MEREPEPPLPLDRVAGCLAGQPDPGGLHPPAPPHRRVSTSIVPLHSLSPTWGTPPTLPLTAPSLLLPAAIGLRELAALLRCKTFELNRELIPLSIFASAATRLDFATAAYLCARRGIRAQAA